MDFLQQNWALLVASVLGTAVVLFVIFRVLDDSARGVLMRLVGEHDDKKAAAIKAQRAVSRTEKKLQKMHGRAKSVRPRHLQEMSDALEDARQLLKIRQDQVLISANFVRKHILEEFPPSRQDGLRTKYLPDDTPEDKPFTF